MAVNGNVYGFAIDSPTYMGEYPKSDRFEFINEIKEMQNVYSTAKKLNNNNEK